MTEKPRSTALALLLAIAAGLWAISRELDTSSPDAGSPLGAAERRSSPPAPLRLADPGRPTDTLRGRVVDPDGLPLEGAVVELGPQLARTDTEGRFVLAHTADPLAVSLEGYFPLRVDAARHRSPSPPGADEVDFVLFPGSSVAGRVTNPEGLPVDGAEVIITHDSRSTGAELRSDRQGNWRSPLLPRGQVHVLVRHPDFQTVDRIVSLARPGSSVRYDARLERGKALLIRVEDTRGAPLADAHVWLDLSPPPGEATGVDSRYLGRTDDLGRIVTRRDPQRDATVRAHLAGFREEIRGVASMEVVLALRPAPVLSGQAVAEQSGLPVTPLRVELEQLCGDSFRPAPHRGILFRSLAEGGLRVGLPPLRGTYRLVVAAENDLCGVSEPVEFDGEDSPPPVLVRLEPQIRLTGFVHSGGEPVRGAELELLDPPDSEAAATLLHGVRVPVAGRPFLRTRSGADGRFTFSLPTRKVFRLSARHAEYAEFLSARLSPALVSGREYPVHLREGARLSGKVRACGEAAGGAGSPVPDMPVVLFSGAGTTRVSWTNSQGDYRFENLPPAPDYRLVLGDPCGYPVASAREEPSRLEAAGKEIAVGEGESVAVDLRARPSTRGSLEGRLTVDGSPRPCELRLIPLGDSVSDRRVAAGASGGFLARALAPGEYRVEGISLPFSRKVTIRPGRRETLEIGLTTIVYRVEIFSIASGAPISRVGGHVEVTPLGGLSGRPATGGLGVADLAPAVSAASRRAPIRDGRAVLRGLFAATYRVRVRVPGFVPVERRVHLRGDRVDRWGLERGKVIQLRLETPDGEPFRGEAEVLILRGERPIHRERREIHGDVVLPALAPGTYSVSIRSSEYTFRRQLAIAPETGMSARAPEGDRTPSPTGPAAGRAP